MKIRKSILSFIIAIALLAGVLGVPAVEAGTYVTLTGITKVGETLTISTDHDYSDIHWYRWNATDGLVFIAHLTDSYVLQPSDLGSVIDVYVILSAGGHIQRTLGPVTTSLVGAPVVGAHIAVEANAPDHLTYQFFRAPTGTAGWVPVQTSTSNIYEVLDDDIDYDFLVNISRTSDGVLLHQTNKIGPVVKFSRDYQLTGNPVVGEVISVDAPDVDNPLFVFYRNSAPGGGWEEIHRSSDSNSYLLQSADEGFNFLVNVHTTDYMDYEGNPLFLHQTNIIGPVARDLGELTLSKVIGEDKYQINIANWNPNFSYQIWTYERVSSGIFEVEDINQWKLKHSYKYGRDFEQDVDGTIKHIFEEFDSVDDRYTVAVNVIDSAGNFVKKMKDTFAPADIGEVIISKVEVDGEFADDKTIVKEIKPGAKVGIEVFTNITAGITYTATVQPVNEVLTAQGSTFEWDISVLTPGRYTVTLEAANGSSDTRTLKFNLFSAITPEGGFASFGTHRPGVATGSNAWSFIFNATQRAESPVGMEFRYTLSEPWANTVASTARQSSDTFTLYLGEEQYGIYHAITRLYRAGSAGIDDGAINTVTHSRPGIETAILDAGHAGGNVPRGSGITITPSITGGPLPGVQYSFWRRDAAGWRLIRDYAETGISWTPARVGDYTIQVRAKGMGAGSYELLQNIEFNVTEVEGDQKLTVSDITLGVSPSPTARRPVTLTANAVNPETEDVLYKFIISDGYLFYIETSYSADPTYTFMAGPARDYRVSVLVKNSASFGKYDFAKTFTVQVS